MAATLKNGDGAYELLQCFFRGFALENVLLLLRSTDPDVVAAGSFVCSELGARAAPLRSEFKRLLTFESPTVRRDILESVLCVANAEDAQLAAAAIMLLDDPVDQVRYKALFVLSRMRPEVLKAAIDFLPTRLGDPLGSVGVEISEHELIALVRSEDAILRKAGVASAARLVGNDVRKYQLRSLDALALAAESSDSDIAGFARNELRVYAEVAEARSLRALGKPRR